MKIEISHEDLLELLTANDRLRKELRETMSAIYAQLDQIKDTQDDIKDALAARPYIQPDLEGQAMYRSYEDYVGWSR